MEELLSYYKALEGLTKKMRLAQWNAKKYGGKNFHQQAWRYGLQIDELIRKENKRQEQLQKQLYAEG
jgi:hypothetical protein